MHINSTSALFMPVGNDEERRVLVTAKSKRVGRREAVVAV